jgi:hypothetical protein
MSAAEAGPTARLEAADQRPAAPLQTDPEELPHSRRQIEGGNAAGHVEQF